MADTFERALRIAVEAHAGQVYAPDEPYILHVLRVVVACGSDDERTVAALHDVVEDTDVTLADLGPVGAFGATVIEQALRRADAAATSGDVVEMIRSLSELRELA